MHKFIFFILTALFCQMNILQAENVPDCFTQLEKQFFAGKNVQQALSLYNVPQASWQNIANDLQIEGQSVIPRVQRRAAGQRPNPLERPFNKKAASQILRTVLYDILVRTLEKYGIHDEVIRQGVFQNLREQNAALLQECLGEEVRVNK